jgi:hypothetical protein
MRLFLALIFLPAFSIAQINIGLLTVGEYYNETVYVGTYDAPGNCTWADGTDFGFNFSGLTPVDGMDYVLIIDTPNPDSTYLLNGWLPVNVGDSTVFDSSTTSLGISAASGPATINFHVRLVGTPTTAGQIYPCWIDAGVTEALCDNIYYLFNGESLVPCLVQSETGISELDDSFSIISKSGQLRIESTHSGQITFFQLDGKLIDQFNIEFGITVRPINTRSTILLVQLESEKGTFSKKTMIQ